jgi:hypothetical protein
MRRSVVVIAAALLCGFSLSPLRAAAPGEPQTLMFGEHRLDWRGAERSSGAGDDVAVSLKTNRGPIAGRYHPARGTAARQNAGVIWLSGAGGGVNGPARGLYAEASQRLQQQGIASLRLDYRKPQDLPGCVLDALCGVAFLAQEGISRVVVVGQSFGGAVAICTGASSPRVKAVVAMSSQTAGSVQMAPYLAPRALLVVQGTRDKVLPPRNAREIYAAAREPKELRYFNDAGHNLLLAREPLLELLLQWIPRQLRRPAAQGR